MLRRGEDWSTLGKTSWSKGENQEGTLPTYGVNIRIRTRTTLVGDKCSHHCATLANDQWPKWISRHLGGGQGRKGEGQSSSLRGSPPGLFLLLVITRGLIIDWYNYFKISEERGTWYSSKEQYS